MTDSSVTDVSCAGVPAVASFTTLSLTMRISFLPLSRAIGNRTPLALYAQLGRNPGGTTKRADVANRRSPAPEGSDPRRNVYCDEAGGANAQPHLHQTPVRHDSSSTESAPQFESGPLLPTGLWLGNRTL